MKINSKLNDWLMAKRYIVSCNKHIASTADDQIQSYITRSLINCLELADIMSNIGG